MKRSDPVPPPAAAAASDTLTGAIGSKAVSASAWVLGGVAFTRLANLAMTVILARILLPEDFGLVALATTVLLMLQAVTDLSLGNALIQNREATRDDYDTAFTLGLIRGVILGLVMILAGVAMVQIYSDQRLFAIMAAISVRPVMAGLMSPYYVTFSKQLRFSVVVLIESLAAVLQLVMAVSVAYTTRSYWGIVAGVIAAGFVPLVASFVFSPYHPRFSIASWRKIMSFSIWVTLNQFVAVLGTRFDNFIVAGFLGTAVFGAYNVGNNIATMATQQAIQPLERVFFPSFVHIVDNRPRLVAAFQKSQSSLFAIGLPLGVGLALVAEPLVALALGDKWHLSAVVIELVAPILGIQVVFGPVNAVAYALGHTKSLFVRTTWQIALRVPIIFLGLYFYGLIGMIIGRMLSGGLLLSILNVMLIEKMIGLSASDQVRALWRSIASIAVMIAAGLVVRHMYPSLTAHEWALSATLSITLACGLTYVSTHGILWLIAGRPSDSIEAEVARLGSSAGRKLLKRKA